MPLTRLLALVFTGVVALDVLGLIVASSTDREDLVDAFVLGTPLNGPFTFVAVQALAAVGAVRLRGRAGRAAAGLLVLLCGLSVFSGFVDGAYDARLAAGERAVQLSVVGLTAVLGLLAAVVAAGGQASGHGRTRETSPGPTA